MKYCIPLLLLLLLFSGEMKAQKQTDYLLHLRSGSYEPTTNVADFFEGKHLFRESFFDNQYLVILQFSRMPDGQVIKRLNQLGIRLGQYLPEKAWLAAVPASLTAPQVAAIPLRAIVPLRKEDKMDTSLLPASFPGEREIYIHFFDGIATEKIQNDLRSSGIGIQAVYEPFQMAKLRVSAAQLNQLAAKPWLMWAEPLNTPVLLNQPGRTNSRANILAEGIRGLNGEGINIGVWDGGIVGPHLDFGNRVHQIETSYLSVAHATHVSGTMAGAGMVNPYAKGVASKANLYVHSLDNGDYVPFEMYRAVQNYGIVITQNSYGDNQSCGSGGAGYKTDNRVHDLLVNQFPHLVHVFAVGNSQGACSPGFRTTAGQAAKNTITVGGVNTYDMMTNFSSWGPVRDGRIKPDVSAVGADVYSTNAWNSYSGGWNGTSMACPLVSGISAQLYQRYRQLNGNTNPVASLIKAVLCNSAHDLGNPGPDYKFGYGRVNALQAVRALEQNRYQVDQVAQGANRTLTVSVPPGATRLRVLIAWTDPAAATNTSVALVNNLDLKVTDPSGTAWQPWKLDPLNPDNNAFRGKDDLNNVEQITIDNPAAGTYQVDVSGFAVPVGASQQYALTWQVDGTSLEVIYPAGGEKINPGGNITVRWNSAGLTGNCTLEYSLDNGNNWTVITNTAQAADQYYDWAVPPAFTAQAKVRISQGSVSDESDDNFTLAGIPAINLSPGAYQITASWNAIAGATGYDVMMINRQTGEWDIAAANVSGTSHTLTGLIGGQTYWISVRARNNALSATGERSVAVSAVTLSGTVSTDIEMETIVLPVNPSCGSLSATEDIVMKVKNNGTTALPAGTVIQASYQVNGGSAVPENITLANPLAAGAPMNYTFVQKADLSTGSSFNIVATVNMPGDAITDNNSGYKLITIPAVPDLSIQGSPALNTCGSTQLRAEGISSTMQISAIPFAPENISTGTTLNLGDDGVSAVPIGFTFNYFGKNYSQVYVSGNGLIGFDDFGLEYASYVQPIPSVNVPNNIIVMAWGDLASNQGGSIKYQTLGTAPNRKLVVEYKDVPYWGAAETVSGQIILYENSNFVEFHITEIQGNNGNSSMGLENSTGTIGVAVPGRSNSAWTASNEGIRFTPYHAGLTWSTGQTTPFITVATPGNYSFTVVENGCTFTRSAAVTSSCDVIPPVVTALSPADNAIAVAVNSNLVITFSENVRAGAGNITVYGGSSPVVIPVTGGVTGTVTFSGNTVTINPAADLMAARNYYVQIDAGAITDFAATANSFAGIADAATWNFSTINNAPTDIIISANSIDENQPAGTVVANLSTVDPDAGDTHTYAIINGATAFTISGNQLIASQSFDFETTATYTVEITATDAGNPALSFTKTFTININDVNEAPTDITLSSGQVDENRAAGTPVGNLTSLDPDAADTHTYMITGGTGATAFAISGAQLVTDQVLDFETISSYTVEITTTDAAGLTFVKTFTVTVNDVNEAPTDILISGSSVMENQPAGTAVGNLSALDPDPSNTHIFSITGGTGNQAFAISGTQLVAAQSLDFETVNSYTVEITATDNGTPAQSFVKTFTILVSDINDAPTLAPIANITVTGNAGQTVPLSGISAGAGETSQTIAVSATSSNPGLIPTPIISYTSPSATGTLSFTPVAGRSGTATITVTVTDNGGTASGGINTFSRLFTITVNVPPVRVRIAQAIVFDSIPDQVMGKPAFVLKALASSGLPVSFAVVSGPATLVNGNMIVLTGVGRVTVKASQTGSFDYLPAVDVLRSFNIGKAPQEITWLMPMQDRIWTTPAFVTEATASSGLPVQLSVVSGPAVLSGNLLTLTGAGRVTLRAEQRGNENYLPVVSLREFEALRAPQTISLDNPVWKMFGDPDFSLNAQTSSGLAPTLSVVSGGIALSGDRVTINRAGEVIIRAEQAGNDQYLPAALEIRFVVQKNAQRITFPLSADIHLLGSSAIALQATSSSGLPVEYEIVSGAASVQGNVIVPTATGELRIRALQRGNENYEAAAPEIRAIRVEPDLFLESSFAGISLCAGSVVEVAYRTNGDFTANNYFAVLLSDANGSFVQPSILGIVSRSSSGRISAVLPQGLPAGNGYRMKVVASSPYRESKDNGQDIRLNSFVVTPAISLRDGLLISNYSSGNQWYHEGKAIAGATGATHQPTEAGNYTLEVSAGNCRATSFPFSYVITADQGIDLKNSLKVYPNPSERIFVAELQLEKVSSMLVVVTDMPGREVYRYASAGAKLQHRHEVDLGHLPSGTYVLRIIAGGTAWTEKIVKE